MTRRWQILVGLTLGLAVVLVVWQQGLFEQAETLPDFAGYSQVSEKKQAFFDYLLPRVTAANQQVRVVRLKLLALKQGLEGEDGLAPSLSTESIAFLRQSASRYRVPNRDSLSEQEVLNQLLDRVDGIPPSLVLAQAANESAWGTSSFARNQLNLFGIWCYTENCGVVPKHRAAGATHQVAAFESVQDCIDYYLLNLNSHPAYTTLRALRSQLREKQEVLSGEHLAPGLLKYSQRGQLYVDELIEMIRFNHLDRLDKA
jgi:Bax protein